MNRLGLKIACLVASIVIWFLVASNAIIDETLQLPLDLVHLPPGCTLAGNDLPEEIRVEVTGSKLHLMAHRYLGIRAGVVQVDLAGEPVGPSIRREIHNEDVHSDDMSVKAILSPDLLFRIDKEETVTVKVEVATSGILPSQRQLVGPPSVEPADVNLIGPARFFTGQEIVRTEPVDLGRLKETQTLRKRLISPHPYLSPDRKDVQVTMSVAVVETRTLANVPIVPLVDADQPEATVFPPVADLVIQGPVDSVRTLVPSRVSVTIPLSGLPEGMHHLRGQVLLPEGFTLVSMEPEEFMAIIGEAGPTGQEDERP
jgi:hypothetical protein